MKFTLFAMLALVAVDGRRRERGSRVDKVRDRRDRRGGSSTGSGSDSDNDGDSDLARAVLKFQLKRAKLEKVQNSVSCVGNTEDADCESRATLYRQELATRIGYFDEVTALAQQSNREVPDFYSSLYKKRIRVNVDTEFLDALNVAQNPSSRRLELDDSTTFLQN